MRRVLITGATGGLGRNAVNLLLAKGIGVRAVGRNPEVGQLLAAQGAEFVRLDLGTATPDQLARLVFGVDAVWHCAALSSPWGRAADFHLANVVATERLLRAAGLSGVGRFVHVSTPALYFDYRHRYDVPESFRPDQYVNDYARTKAAAEDCVRQAAERHAAMRVVTLRPRAIFGPHDRVLLPRLLRLWQRGDGTLPLPRGGRVTLDLTYVENVVQAMWLATKRPGLASGAVFNITNQQPVQLADALYTLFTRELGRPLRIVDLPYRLLAATARLMQWGAALTGREPSLTPYSVGALSFDLTLDNRLAREQLGYVPAIDLAEGFKRTAKWWGSHG